ncbi:hypothetical protein CHS0354_026353 [Potamilus streckersoni]|uniref:Mitochondria-eating protein n=1 Tax=Potamilus streckersoni TaxID=2493646 RepID=A0AAE0W5H1_9BIVA|nr:hypothetical protein CHS0354_026353 [Potamilus streckersoni]
MACIQNPSSTDNDASNIEELIDALRDIQSVDFDKLRAILSQSQSEGASRCRCREYEKMKVRCGEIESERNHYKTDFENLLTDKARIEIELARFKEDLREKEHDFSEQRREISRLQGHVTSVETELRAVREQLQNYQYQVQSKEEKQQTPNEATMKTEAERQMPIGESMIPDMSDQNELANLGTRYSDLYDNEWLNAFDVLTSKFCTDDKIAIELLRRILLECYKNAFEMSEMQMMKAEHVLSGSSRRVNLNCKRLLKEARKHVDIKQADDLVKKFLEAYLVKAIPKTYLTEPVIQMFATACFQLCWLMSMHDPPAAFAEDPVQGDQFDTNIYKYYTVSGDTIDTLVWPALLLHENGPLLAKGIAQSYPRIKALSAPTTGQPLAKEVESSEITRQGQYLKNGTEAKCGCDTTQYGNGDQGNAELLSNVDQDQMRIQTNGSNYGAFSPMPNAPSEAYAFQPTQHYQNQMMTEWERFQFFCQAIRMYDEPSVRNMFGPDFDRCCWYFRHGFPRILAVDPSRLNR